MCSRSQHIRMAPRARYSPGEMMRTTRWIAAIVGVVAIVGIGLVLANGWSDQSDARVLSAITSRAAQYQVRIRRDQFGVPHVKGATDADVAFGIGFAHSEDDFSTIQLAALATRGELAATEGIAAAPGDYIVHLMRVWETVNGKYSTLPADLRRVLEAYADGVNEYAALNPSRVQPGLLPLTGKDIAAGFVFKTPFFYGFDSVLRKLTAKTNGEPIPEIG